MASTMISTMTSTMTTPPIGYIYVGSELTPINQFRSATEILYGYPNMASASVIGVNFEGREFMFSKKVITNMYNKQSFFDNKIWMLLRQNGTPQISNNKYKLLKSSINKNVDAWIDNDFNGLYDGEGKLKSISSMEELEKFDEGILSSHINYRSCINIYDTTCCDNNWINETHMKDVCQIIRTVLSLKLYKRLNISKELLNSRRYKTELFMEKTRIVVLYANL